MFINSEDVQISVSAPSLDVPVVGAVPLIERFENVDLMTRNEVSRALAVRDGWHAVLSY
jgi:hypothetical protein